MEIMDLMVIIKWFFVWAAVTFVLGGILMLYLKNAEYAAKALDEQAKEDVKKSGANAENDIVGDVLLDTDDMADIKKISEGDNDENSGNKSQDSGD